MNAHQRAYADAEVRRKRCEMWLVAIIERTEQRIETKDALFARACQVMDLTRSNFDQAWIGAIERTGRHDWYEPLRRGRGQR